VRSSISRRKCCFLRPSLYLTHTGGLRGTQTRSTQRNSTMKLHQFALVVAVSGNGASRGVKRGTSRACGEQRCPIWRRESARRGLVAQHRAHSSRPYGRQRLIRPCACNEQELPTHTRTFPTLSVSRLGTVTVGVTPVSLPGRLHERCGSFRGFIRSTLQVLRVASAQSRRVSRTARSISGLVSRIGQPTDTRCTGRSSTPSHQLGVRNRHPCANAILCGRSVRKSGSAGMRSTIRRD